MSEIYVKLSYDEIVEDIISKRSIPEFLTTLRRAYGRFEISNPDDVVAAKKLSDFLESMPTHF